MRTPSAPQSTAADSCAYAAKSSPPQLSRFNSTDGRIEARSSAASSPANNATSPSKSNETAAPSSSARRRKLQAGVEAARSCDANSQLAHSQGANPAPFMSPPPLWAKEVAASAPPLASSLFEYLCSEISAREPPNVTATAVNTTRLVSKFWQVPFALERCMTLGFFICFDCFLDIFTLLPLRLAAAVGARMRRFIRGRPGCSHPCMYSCCCFCCCFLLLLPAAARPSRCSP